MMKLELKPCFDDGEQKTVFNANHAGCTEDGHLAWVYSDSLLEVYLPDSDEIVASWRFGKVLRDKNTKISCITDLKYEGGHMLLVATSNSSDQGTLCLFSISKRKVIRAVEFPQRITAMEVLFSNLLVGAPAWVMNPHLDFFCGLVAVGTSGGYLYLTDLCLDELMINPTTEAEPKKLSIHSANLVDTAAKRERARAHNKHMAVLLDDRCHRDEEFYYRRQDDSIQKVFEEGDVHITSLKYLSQSGILAIGFNFGCFQLWRLHGPTLDYASRYTPNSPAVSHFLLHEPENDPRKLLYMWIGHDDSILDDEENSDSVATISLYQLCFETKEFYPNFGLFYEGLESVYFWMNHSLSLDPYTSETKGVWSSQLINAYTISNPLYQPLQTKANDSFEEGLHSHDQSLSVFVWKVDVKQGSGTSHYWMAVFDLNRWYHAQMPHAIRCMGNAPQVCSYWAVNRLDDVAACSSPPAILNVHVTGNNIVRFVSSSSLPPLEHSYPSALEISDVRFITRQRIIRGHCYGWQGQLLQDLLQDGANYLVQPADFFHQCLRARLVPQINDSDSGPSVDRKRHALLNLSLDYRFTPFLIHQCVELWADGEYAQMGCSLKFLLDWAWECVVKIKEKLHSTCEPLFDWSGQQVTSHALWALKHQHRSLVCLEQIFDIFLSLNSPLTETGELELELRQATIKLFLQHYEVLLWCLSEALLPEVEEGSTVTSELFAYPVSEMCIAYQKRRQEMARMEGVMEDYPLLLIDGLVSCEGSQISELWESRGGNGLYPPPSMQAAIYSFQLEDVSPEVKQAVMLYLLLDLASVSETHSESLVTSFIQRFMIAPNFVHKVQGIWFLDHRDYEEGLRQLVSPNGCSQDWTSWMDVAVVNSLLAQGQSRTATCFVHSGHWLGGTVQEQKLMISVLVRSSKVSQAVEFMRRCCRDEDEPGDLMTHLLKECHDEKQIGQLLQLHFKAQEEAHIERYMRERTEHASLEPLFLYYLHSSRFVQAFQLNEEMNRLDRMEASMAAQERSSNRNRLMTAYLKVLPDITRKMIVEAQRKNLARPVKRIRVSHPTPLSTVIHKQNQQSASSRSSFMLALIEKVNEVADVVEEVMDEAPQLMADLAEDQYDERFLKTPITPRSKSFTRPPNTTTTTTDDAIQSSEVMEVRQPANPLSAAKQRTLMGEEAETTEGYRSLHALTMECLSVLKTPSKERIVNQSPKTSALASSQMKTPQSILKVRRISRSSFSKDGNKSSLQLKLSSPHSRPKKLGFSTSEPSLLSSPSPSSSGWKPLPQKTTTPSVTTPKHLRFVGLSPTPSPSPSVMTHSRDLSRSPSEEDSQEVWTDALEVSVDEEPVKDHKDEVFKSPEAKETVSQVKEHVNEKVGDSDDVKNVVDETPGISISKDARDDDGSDDQESMDVTPQVIETVTHSLIATRSGPSLEEHLVGTGSPPERYDDKLGELVRPNLMSPWKHDLSSEEAVEKMVMEEDQEETAVNLDHREEKESPSPLLSVSTRSATCIEVQGRPFTSLRDSARSQEKIDPFNSTSSTTKVSLLETTISIADGSTQRQDNKSRGSRTAALSQSLSIDTSGLGPTISGKVSTTPEDRKRELSSPPATPPSSKMIKMQTFLKERHSSKQTTTTTATQKDSLVTSRKSLSPVTRSTEAEESLSTSQLVQKRDVSPKLSARNKRRASPPGETDRSVTKSNTTVQVEPTEDFIPSEVFLQQREIASEQASVSLSRRVSSRLHAGESSANSSVTGRQSLRSAASARESLAVFQEMESLLMPKKSTRQSLRGRSKTPERNVKVVDKRVTELVDKRLAVAEQSEAADSASSAYSLRRSERQSKTPERQARKVKEGVSLQQTVEEEKASATDLRKSRRHSKTPERVVRGRKSSKDTETSTITTDGEKTLKDDKREKDVIVHSSQESDMVSEEDPIPHAVANDTQVISETIDEVAEPSSEATDTSLLPIESTGPSDELDQPSTTLSRKSQRSQRQSKTPDRLARKTKEVEQKEALHKTSETDSESSNMEMRRSRRLSKTPERVVKKSKIDAVAIDITKVEKTAEDGHGKKDEIFQSGLNSTISETTTIEAQLPSTMNDEPTVPPSDLRRSRRQSKTPERVVKKRQLEESTSSSMDDESAAGHLDLRRSRRQSKTPERVVKKAHLEETTSSSGQEEHLIVTRQSSRQSKTPEHTIDDDVSEKDNMAESSTHTLRQTRRSSKTPERVVRRSVSREMLPDIQESGEENVRATRSRFTRKSKTPERVPKKWISKSPERDEPELAVSTSQESRNTRRRSKTPERKGMGVTSEDQASEMEEGSMASVRRSRRQGRTPERLISSIEGSPRKSSRPQKSPEKLNTPEIESLLPVSPLSRAQHLKPDSPATPPKHVAQASSSSSARTVLTPTRKSTRQPKSPERLNTDQIEPVGKSFSPNRSSLTDQATSSNKASPKSPASSIEGEEAKTSQGTSVPKSPSRRSKKQEPKPAEEWQEEMPPLRLEMDEGEGKEDEEEEQPASSQSPDVEMAPTTSFAFSVPASYATRSHDDDQGKSNEANGQGDSVFLFSNPTPAKNTGKDIEESSKDVDTANTSLDTASTSQDTASTSQDTAITSQDTAITSLDTASTSQDTASTSQQSDSRQGRKMVTRNKKKLYNYSPKLVSPLADWEAEHKLRSKTKRESQRASTSLLRRYSKGSGPLTRRVLPSRKK